jgi:threonine/homoserine/homoserine lactone efflux protein
VITVATHQLSKEQYSLSKLVAETLIITPSGAMSPGILSATAVIVGMHIGVYGGFLVALGHMLFEIPYIAVIMLWTSKFSSVLKRLERPLALLTLLVATYFALGLVSEGLSILINGELKMGSVDIRVDNWLQAVFYGMLFTGANPHFLAWWLTIALPLVQGASQYGLKGFAVMYASHVWMDYVWLIFLAFIGAGLALMARLYGFLLLVMSALLLVFGLDVFTRTYMGKRVLPFQS